MNLYLTKLGIHTEHSMSWPLYFWDVHCPLSPLELLVYTSLLGHVTNWESSVLTGPLGIPGKKRVENPWHVM